MGSRIGRRHSEEVRGKIQASVIIDRLQKHVSGELEMTPTQVQAANSLLDRSIPKLQTIQHVGDPENPVEMRMVQLVTSADDLLKKIKGKG